MKKIQLGIAMIEVIFSMGIISLVLLSLLIYQISMNKNSYKMNLQAIAVMQLENFSEMLLANQKNSYREKLLTQWNENNANLLPQGQGSFVDNGDDTCEITLQWFSGKFNTQSIVVYC